MEKGFTLVELVAVLIILSLVATIATVTVNKTINNSKKNLSKIQISNIEDAAKVYYIKEGMSNNSTCVSVIDLISKGYVDSKDIKNPDGNESMRGSVKITYESNQYSYEYQENNCE